MGEWMEVGRREGRTINGRVEKRPSFLAELGDHEMRWRLLGTRLSCTMPYDGILRQIFYRS